MKLYQGHKPWLKEIVTIESKEYTIVQCHMCKRFHKLEIGQASLMAWLNGTLIQHVVPEMPGPERELLISGTCDDCWKKLWRHEEIEEQEAKDA